MNEVTLVFQGMVLFWATSTPPVVLVPDLSKMSVSHTSTISAPMAAFKTGTCPRRFVANDKHRTCTMTLNRAGKDGGSVQIEVASAAAETRLLLESAMCAMPKLQQPDAEDPLELLPEFTPPAGKGNAAWMRAIGGTPSAFMVRCEHGEDCPRYLHWKVPVAADSNAILVLRNLKHKPHDMMVELVAGAEVTVKNVPDEGVLLARAKERANRKPDPVLEVPDWCMYFQMVKTKKKDPELRCQLPTVPECNGLIPIGTVTSHKHASSFLLETIACSSSQYP